MKYCVQCGAPLDAERTGRVCASCGETAAGALAVTTPMDEALNWKDIQTYIRFLRGLLRNPEGTMKDAASYAGYIPGLVAAGLASIVLALIILGYIRTLVGVFDSFLMEVGFWFGSGFGMEIPYFSLFIRFLLLFLVQWVLLSGLLLGAAKITKQPMPAHLAFNLAGFVKFYFSVAAFAAMIAGFINVMLGIGLFGGALALSTLLLYQGIRSVASKHATYLVAVLLSAYYIAQLLLVRIFA